VLHLTISVVPPGDACGNSSIKGTWRLVARVPRQAVWKPLSLATRVERQAIFDEADTVRSLRDFGRYLKGQMLEYSWSCGSGWKVIRAFFELWLGIASVPACVLQVVACRLDNNDSLRLSTKDVEDGLHGGGHV